MGEFSEKCVFEQSTPCLQSQRFQNFLKRQERLLKNKRRLDIAVEDLPLHLHESLVVVSNHISRHGNKQKQQQKTMITHSFVSSSHNLFAENRYHIYQNTYKLQNLIRISKP